MSNGRISAPRFGRARAEGIKMVAWYGRPSESSGLHPESAQHSLARSILLHLLPGVLILVSSLWLSPLAMRWGYPPLLGLLLAAAIGIGAQLVHLVRLGRVRNRRWSLEGVVLYREPLAPGRTAAIVLGCVITAIIALGLMSPVDRFLTETVFSWLPPWFFYGDPEIYGGYARSALLLTLWVRLALDGLLLPVIEELYFRGYLMPRLDRFGGWTPLISHGLFTVYHLWQPQNYPTIFIGIFPMVWAAWRWRGMKISLITHVLLNLIGGVLAFGLVLGTAGGG